MKQINHSVDKKSARVTQLVAWNRDICACGVPSIVDMWHDQGLPDNPTSRLLEYVASDDQEYQDVGLICARCKQLIRQRRRLDRQ